MPLTTNEGTQTDIYSVNNGGTEIPIVKWDVGSGTTLSDYGAIGGQIGMRHADAFATVVTTGTNTLGTIRAGVSGSAIYVTDITISVGSASNVEIGNGGTANNILGTLYFAANGGAVMNFKSPIFTSAGSALVYKQSTGGPMSITCQGYVD